jgi:hypothetical protein
MTRGGRLFLAEVRIESQLYRWRDVWGTSSSANQERCRALHLGADPRAALNAQRPSRGRRSSYRPFPPGMIAKRDRFHADRRPRSCLARFSRFGRLGERQASGLLARLRSKAVFPAMVSAGVVYFFLSRPKATEPPKKIKKKLVPTINAINTEWSTIISPTLPVLLAELFNSSRFPSGRARFCTTCHE